MTIYTVKSGDTLYEIAKKTGAEASLIARDNQLRDPDRLTVGQTLVIRTPQKIHKAADGENIYSVAQRYGVTVNSIWRNNPSLGGGTSLVSGDSLVVEDEQRRHSNDIVVNAYVYSSADKNILRKTLPYMTYLSIFSYGIEEDGSLTEIDDVEIIDLARSYGVSPLMTVSNLDQEGYYSPDIVKVILTDRDIQDVLIGEIVRTVAEKRYGGVGLDFEYIPKEQRQDYVDFVSRLNEKLGSGGYPVFVSVMPKAGNNENEALFEGQDKEAIGSVADGLFLQCYGWGNKYGAPTAIAPWDLVKRSLENTVGQTEGKRILMGIPNYGYNWRIPFMEGDAPADGIGNREAELLAAQKGVAIEYDEGAQAPFFKYYESENGETAERTVWFQDARSIEKMLEGVSRWKLGGVSVWNAMKYYPQLWLMLNGMYGIAKALK